MKCPTPGKKAHPTQMQAENAMRRQWRNPRPGRTHAIRAYHCPCGKWHLTHKPYNPTTQENQA